MLFEVKACAASHDQSQPRTFSWLAKVQGHQTGSLSIAFARPRGVAMETQRKDQMDLIDCPLLTKELGIVAAI
jgi:hypothetical protein